MDRVGNPEFDHNEAKVEVPKGVLAGLAVLAAAGVLGLAFLLGRESGRRAPAEPPKASLPQVGAPAAGQSAPTEPPAPELPPAQSAPSAVAPSQPPASDPARAAVAAYFQALEHLQPEVAGDPTALAQQILADLARGDSSGFEGMIRKAESARDRLAAIVPPAPCAEHHRESLACMEASLALTRGLRKALSSPDALPRDFADRASALKARTEALQRQEKALKERFGLK